MATAARSRTRLRTIPTGLLVVLGLGLLLRAGALAGYYPSVLQWQDSGEYARAAPTGFFDVYWWPAGYTAFLIAVRSAWDELGFTIAVQHLLGLVTAVLLYASARRLGAPRGVALVPAAIAALVGDYVYLEHLVMADSFFILVLAAGLYLAVRGLAGEPRWLVAAAVVLAASGLVRTTGLAVCGVLALVVLVAGPATWRRRVGAAALVAAASAAVVGAYALIATTGKYDGLFTMSGWHTYARVAPTADCRRFTPPAGTEFLCETTPVQERYGSFGYEWNANTPARLRFPFPEGNETLGRFGRAAILGDPVTYAKVVVKDVVRAVEPSAGRDRPGSGQPGDIVVFGHRSLPLEQALAARLDQRYDGVAVNARWAEPLDTYQRATRFGALEKLLLIVLAAVGLWAARGATRAGIALFAGSAAALVVVPALTLSYDIRYTLPPVLLMSVAAAAGGWAAWASRR